MSRALLSAPSSSSIANALSTSTSSPIATVQFRNFDNNNTTTSVRRGFDIPSTIDSPETLEFIGFTSSIANAIFQKYQTRPNPAETSSSSLLDHVYDHILILDSDLYADELPLKEAMTRAGLTQETQDNLTDPEFKAVFWTESLHYWVKDTLTINYRSLCGLHRRLKNHAVRSEASSAVTEVQGAQGSS